MSRTDRPIYLDYNATTPHDPEVVEAMRPYLESEYGNPSSSHVYGTEPRRAVARARNEVATLLHARSDEILFTSGGTESNNYAIIGAARARSHQGSHIITSVVEHPAVANTCDWLEREGFSVTRIPVDRHGLVDPKDVQRAIRPETILVTVMHANNEIGTIEPIREIAAITAAAGAIMHTDAAQSLGKIPVDVEELGVDLLTIAGHKLYAPKGVGALYVRSGIRLEPLMHGGSQEGGRRPGTENTLEIVGLGTACRIAARDLAANQDRMRLTRDRLHDTLSATGEVRLNGHPDRRLPNTLNVSFRDVASNELIEALSQRVAVSAGSACHADSVTLSPVIRAIGTPLEWGRGTIRFSTGKLTTMEEVDQAGQAIIDAWLPLRNHRP
ncbi:MAG: cysteine desulfurase family protein [Alkalispirochaeta sp.]